MSFVLCENENFEINFDLPTPRPHFIITLKRSKNGTIRDLTNAQIESMLQLINTFCNTKITAMTNITISFHVGSFSSRNSPHFHGHICVQLDDYLNFFKRSNINIETFQPTRQWDKSISIKTKKDLYIQSVQNYYKKNKDNCAKYQKEDVAKCSSTTPPMLTQTSFNGFQLEYSLSEPKIGFSSNENNGLKLIRSMCDFVYPDCIDKAKSGAHVCLKIDPNRDRNNNNTITSGYLLLKADYLYKIHPKREEFLKNFSRNQNFYINT
jgi:diadenosine tetraphosphate (Ap4A) HIT family hydrolase